MTRGMRRIVTVLKGGFALLSCGHLSPTWPDSYLKVGCGFLRCPICSGPQR